MKNYYSNSKEQEIVKGLDEATLKRIMTPKNDLIFKKLFGTVGRENIVKDFLEAILEVEIESLELGKETIILPEELNERTGVLDVKVTLKDGTSIDIEMQNAQNYFVVKRAHFYASRMYGSQLKSGGKYKDLKKVIVIFITNFDIFNKLKSYHTKWLVTEQQDLNEKFEEIELHFIEMPKFLASKYNKKRKIDQWLLFLDYSKKELLEEVMEENKNVKEAEENMERLMKDEDAKYLAWLRDKRIWDENSLRDEGYEEGFEKGELEGKKEGKKEANIEIAKRLKEMGLSNEEISKATELSIEEIENI